MTKTLMKKTITKALVRGACVATLAGLVLAVTPEAAQAQFITFEVVEGAVDGTPDNTFDADLLNGGYAVNLNLIPDGGDVDPTDGTGTGTWTETAVATFTQYYLGGTALSDPYIGDVEPDGYRILGTLTASGTYEEDTCGIFNCLIFTFDSQSGSLGIDDDNDGVVDDPLLTASGVATGSGGSILLTNGPTGGTGSFNSVFSTTTLAGGIAPLYWPTLDGLTFNAIINGDLSQISLPSLTGDVSVQFVEIPDQVPEPATLTLLGLGLFGVAGAARRRRAPKA